MSVNCLSIQEVNWIRSTFRHPKFSESLDVKLGKSIRRNGF